MARDYPRHRPPKHRPIPPHSFDEHNPESSDWQEDLEQRLEQERSRMRHAHSDIYTDNNITGLNQDDPPYAPTYHRDYSTEGYVRDHPLEYDPNRGRGQAYRHDYGREQYGRQAYRDTYRSGTGYPSSGPNYRGRGPKGYQRSDQYLLADVCERLSDDPRIDASDIEVSVSEGEITLSGTVDSRASKRMAEHVAESCGGVKDVHNQLRIAPADESESAQINM